MSGFHKKNNEAAVNLNAVNPDGTPVARVRLPKKWNREQFALAETMLGANHIRVQCMDGVTRMGRIKGKIKKRAWIREGDTVLVIPWSFQDEKCDIIYRYLKPQTDWLRKNRDPNGYFFVRRVHQNETGEERSSAITEGRLA